MKTDKTMPKKYKKQSVLIIDDQPSNLSLTADFLESQGVEVMMAKSGLDGIETAKDGQPSLILLDVKMPDIDGYETCHRLLGDERTKHIPIIFMTALTELDDKLKAFAVGGVDYVTKPIHEAELLARVGVHLQLSELKAELEEKNKRLENALDTASVVNVAIGVLMAQQKIPNKEAFEIIRKQARSQRRRVGEVASDLLATLEN